MSNTQDDNAVDRNQPMGVVAYTRYRGLKNHNSVRDAILRGRLHGPALTTDERGRTMIIPAIADVQWARNTDPVEAAKNGNDYSDQVHSAPVDQHNPPSSVEPEPAGAAAPAADGEDDGPSYHESRAKREAANAELARIELLEKLGLLVPAQDVAKAAAATARVVREAMLVIPDRVSSLLAAETDPSRIHSLLTNELRLALNGLAQRPEPVAAAGAV